MLYLSYNLVGGEHNNEILILSNLGKSFKDRDQMIPASKEAQDDLYANVHQHLEDITGGDGGIVSSLPVTVFEARLPLVAASTTAPAGSVMELKPSPSVT